MKMIGADAFVKSLQKEGVDVLFCYPGGQVIPEFDALYTQDKVKHILVRHEQGAAHAADGYARVTGKVGVCLATSGPGGTNLVTGIANAYMDSIPMVAFTGQVPTSMIGTDFFQEADITGITLPITKHNYLVKDVRELPQVIKEAFYIASTGRPGPVLIDIPGDVARAPLPSFDYPESVKMAGYKPTYKGHARQIKQAANMIAEAERPLLYAGGGILRARAWKELAQLAELAKIPVCWTLMGKGAFPDTHELNIGMPGMHGARYTNYSICHCDLLIGVGVRFDDRVTGKLAEFATDAKKVHIDIDPAEIGKNVPIDVPIVGDAKNVLGGVLAAIKGREGFKPKTGAWLDQIEQWRKRYPLAYDQGEGAAIKPEFLVEQIYETTKDREAIIATEVGQNQMWAAQFYQSTQPLSFVSSGGLGTMGFGLPAAMGAKFGAPDKLVIDIAGDGSIQMNSQEFATCVANGLDLKVVIINNGYLGMVRQWQELFWDKRYSDTDLRVGTPDFVKLVEAYGGTGMRIERPEEVAGALEKAYETPGVVVLDVLVEREQNVYPMVAPGAPIKEMLGGVDLDEMFAADA
ncbi:MAG: biosynthetic-type acetolactate synthase large subunit [Actinobacteria bacterium]|nr:MAG: biosynthetic-type acetolactate synthase large subunit [Actinomycetota bacterium]